MASSFETRRKTPLLRMRVRSKKLQGLQVLMGKITGFLEIERHDRKYAPVAERVKNYQRIRHSPEREGNPRPGRALHELRHSLLPRHRLGRAGHAGLPGQQPDPGLQRSGLPGQLGRSLAQPALDQQFPGIHRPHLPGAVRSLLHAQHRRQSGHHQNHRMRDRRSRLGQWLAQAGNRARTRPARRSRWSAPARRGWPARSSSRAPATTCMCSRSSPRPAACCATAFPTSRWKSTSSTAAWRRWKPRASPSTTAPMSAAPRGAIDPRETARPI